MVWKDEWQGGPPGGGLVLGYQKWLRYMSMFYYQPSRYGFPHLTSNLYFGTGDVDLNGFVLSETVGAKSFDLSSIAGDGYANPPYHAIDSGPIEAVSYYAADLDASAKTSLNYPLNFQQVYQKRFSGNLYLPTGILSTGSGLPGSATLSDSGQPIFSGSISGLSFTASLK